MSWMTKYRPKSFEEVVGQNVIKKILSESLKNNKLMHSYIFFGPFGTGKCVYDDTMIYTDGRIQRIGDFYKQKKKSAEVMEASRKYEILKLNDTKVWNGVRHVDAGYLYKEEVDSSIELVLPQNVTFGGSNDHLVKMLNPKTSSIDWVKLQDIRTGDLLVGVREGKEYIKETRIPSLVGDFQEEEAFLSCSGSDFVYSCIILAHERNHGEFRFKSEKERQHFQIRAFNLGLPLIGKEDTAYLPTSVLAEYATKRNSDFNFHFWSHYQKFFRSQSIWTLGENLCDCMDFLTEVSSNSSKVMLLRSETEGKKLNWGVAADFVSSVEKYNLVKYFEDNEEILRKFKTLREVVQQRYFFTPVLKKKKINTKTNVYDLVLPRGHSFKSDLLLSHNTSLARVFSRAILCDKRTDFEPCNEDSCPSCSAHLQGRHADYLEFDAASKGSVDEVRKIKEFASLEPWMSKKKIFVIDEMHDLSRQANDALLKQLEEVLDSTIYIFCTTEIEKVPFTVKSRSSLLNVLKPTEAEIVERLKKVCTIEGIKFEESALGTIVRQSNFHVRDCLKSLEISNLFGEITNEAVEKFFNLDINVDLVKLLASLSSKNGLSDSIDRANKVLHRISFADLYKKMAELLVDIERNRLGISILEWRKTADWDKYKEEANKVLQAFGDKIYNVIAYLFRKAREVDSFVEVVADLFVIEAYLRGAISVSVLDKEEAVKKELRAIQLTNFSEVMSDPKKMRMLAKRVREPEAPTSISQQDKVEEAKLTKDVLKDMFSGLIDNTSGD